MNRTVSLWICLKGSSSQIKPTYLDTKQTRLKPQDGEYYLLCAKKWYPVGNDPLLALDAKAAKEKLLRDVERGTAPVSESLPHLNLPLQETRLTMAAAIKEYLTTGKAAEKDWRKHTLQCYTLALRLFREACKKTFIEEIDGDDLRRFKVHLRQQKTSVGAKIDPRTVYNHFLNTVSFLNTYKRRDLIPQSEWPRFEEKKVECYEPREMAQWLKFADVDETDVAEFFLGVGFRNGEGAHTEYPDIDFENAEIHIYSKREKFDWQVKDSEQRIIGISQRLVDRLRARRERHPNDELVFPNSKGQPDRHLLRIIKRVALRAGLNCTRCVGTYERKRVSCSTHPVCKRWIVHTFRKTWATYQRRVGVRTDLIQEGCGHSSEATTLRYLAGENRRTPERRAQIEAAAALVQIPEDSTTSIQ